MTPDRRPTAVIAEDEPVLARTLARLLERTWPELQIVGVAEDGLSATELALAETPDVVFLDIKMPGRSGIEVAAAVADDWPDGRAEPLFVFVTAHDEFALSAFERAAVDYLAQHDPTKAAMLRTSDWRAARQRLAQPGRRRGWRRGWRGVHVEAHEVAARNEPRGHDVNPEAVISLRRRDGVARLIAAIDHGLLPRTRQPFLEHVECRRRRPFAGPAQDIAAAARRFDLQPRDNRPRWDGGALRQVRQMDEDRRRCGCRGVCWGGTER